MKKTLLVCTLLALTLGARLDFDNAECNNYLKKFGTANNADGTGASKLAFSGDAAFVGTTSDVKVNLRYSDVELFNDAKYFGLVQQDGKTAESTCLDMKLYKFADSTYAGGTEVTDLTITASNNFNKQWRYYSFTILGADLPKRMVQTQNSENFIYKGYYAIAYYAAGADQLQYTFYFDFTVTVNRWTGSAVDTAFLPLSYTSTLSCTPEQSCVAKPDTSLQWCTDFTCTAFSTPDLHLNDQYVLLQSITTKGLTNYFLTESEVWYTGNGLNKKATIKQIDNTTPGQVKLLLNAEIAWKAVTIKVSGVLSTTAAGRRLMQQTTFDTVTGQTDEITCIKAQGSDVCSTCVQEFIGNGYASDGCICCFSNFLAFAFLAILLVIAF